MTLSRGIDFLEQLSLSFGPSGCEGNVANLLKAQLLALADEVTTDKLGSLIALYKGTGKKRADALVQNCLLLVTSMDEAGFMIQSIDDKGYLHPAKLSIQDGKILVGRSVTIGNENSQIQGYMGTLPAHQSKGETSYDDLYIDIGAKNKEEAENHVHMGDFGTFRSAFQKMGGENPILKGKALDGRTGCAILCDVLAALRDTAFRPPFDICFAFTRRGKIGASTARTAAYQTAPDAAILVETSDTQNQGHAGKLGNGPMVFYAAGRQVYDRPLTDFLLATAQTENIPCQPLVSSDASNPSGSIYATGTGIRCAAVSAPIRYPASAACILRESDYTHMVQLLLKTIHAL